jgi:hypothetical protein
METIWTEPCGHSLVLALAPDTGPADGHRITSHNRRLLAGNPARLPPHPVGSPLLPSLDSSNDGDTLRDRESQCKAVTKSIFRPERSGFR